MKLYILRHEERPEDCSFFTPLTENGLNNAVKIAKILQNEKINLIFCSPFIRTLQTIFPYAKKNNILINLEYSLSEIHHQDIIPKKALGIELPYYLAKGFNVNFGYKSFINSKEIIYPEKYIDVSRRLRRFLKEIFIKYINTDYNIIIVTHQSLCVSSLKINKDIINHKIVKNYPLGKICLIYDNNKWSFKEIN
jgi:broad specificity phosphatase PhoE